MNYESCKMVASTTLPGVSFTLRRMSVGRRLELTRRLRELLGRIEFLEAGADPCETLQAAELASEVDKVYLAWGLKDVQGIEIDGEVATPESLAACGPEGLCKEIVAAIRAECSLSETERKN
jgi:hypothetical protein